MGETADPTERATPVTPEAADYDLEIKGREKPVQQAVWTLWRQASLPTSALAQVEDA